jgi:hypothetical protein
MINAKNNTFNLVEFAENMVEKTVKAVRQGVPDVAFATV